MGLSTAGIKGLQKLQLVDEVTAGTNPATGFNIWRGVGEMPEDVRVNNIAEEMIGVTVPTDRYYVPQTGGSLSMAQTEATFDQLPIIMSASIDGDVSGTLSGTSEYAYTYTTPNTSTRTIKTYSLEGGDNQQAYAILHAYVESWVLTGQAGEAVQVSAQWLGRGMTKTTFTASPTTPTVEEILTQKGSLWIDDAGSMGTTSVSSTLLEWTLTYNSGWSQKFTVDSNTLDFDFIYLNKDNVSAELQVTFEHNTSGVTQFDEWQLGEQKDIQIQVAGSTIGGGGTFGTHMLQIQLTGYWTKFEPIGEQDGNSIIQGTFTGAYDVANATDMMGIVIANTKADVPE